MTARLVHVARNGKIIGQYPPEQLASLMDSGHFFESDFCLAEGSDEWLPLPEFLKSVEAPRYTRTKPREEGGAASPSSSTERSSRHGRRSRKGKPQGAMLAGWIAFLLAVSALAGAGFWIAGLYGQLGNLEQRILETEKKLTAKDKELQRVLFAAREIAEPGVVRGSMILRNDAGKRVAMPGVQVSLYPRKLIEEHLDARHAMAKNLPEGKTVVGIQFFLDGMPQAEAMTATDASGRYEFAIPGPGEYVVSALLPMSPARGPSSRLWFVAFNSEDPLNTVVDLTESNGVQQLIPSLMIVEGR